MVKSSKKSRVRVVAPDPYPQERHGVSKVYKQRLYSTHDVALESQRAKRELAENLIGSSVIVCMAPVFALFSLQVRMLPLGRLSLAWAETRISTMTR